MATAENIAAQVARDLAESKAKLASWVGVKVRRDDATTRDSIRFTRFWSKITDGLRAEYETKLRESTYVTDPEADGETRSGRWRVLRVYTGPLKTDPTQQGVYQTLLYWPDGYGDFGDYCAESSPLAHTDVQVYVDSPDLADCEHANDTGHVYQAVNRLDPETGLWNGEYRDDIARRFPETPGTASENWSGTRTEHRKNCEARNDTVTPYPTEAALESAVEDGKSIQSSFSINRYGRFDWSTVESTPQQYPPEGEDAAQHVHGTILVKETTSARVNAAYLPEDDQPEEAGSATDLSFSLTAEGFFNWTHNLEEAAVFPAESAAEITFGGPLSETTHQERLNDTAVPTIEAGAVGYNTRGQFSINRFGYYDWSTDDEEAQAFPVAGAAEITFGGPLSETTHQERLNDTAVPTIEAGAVGYNTRGQFSINRFGYYDWSTDDEEAQAFPVAGAAEITFGGPLSETTHQEKLNDSTVPVIEPGAAGHNTRGQFSINRFGYYDWSTDDEEAQAFPVAGAAEITFGGPLSETTHQEKLNDSTVPVIEPGAAGHNTRGQFSINRFGYYDWSTDDEEAQAFPVAGAAEITFGGPLSETTHQEKLNDTGVPVIEPGAAGHNTRGQFSINRFGYYDWSTDDEEAQAFPVAGAAEITFGGPLSETTHQERLNDTAVPTIEPGAAGHNTRGQFSINRFGYYDWSTDDEEAHAFPAESAAEITFGGPLSETTHQERMNDTAVPTIAAGTAGHNTRGQFSINRFGRFDWNTDDEACVTFPVAGPAQIVFGGPLSAITHQERMNDTAVPTIAAGTAGHNTRGQFSINRFGKYDWSTDDEEAIADETTWQESSKYEVTDGLTFENHAEMPDAPTATGIGTPIVRVQVSINRFGYLDGAISVTSATEGFQAGPITLEDSYQQKVDRTWFFNQESAPTGATKSLSGGDVTVKTFSPELNKFNLWDYSETTTIIHTGASATSYFLYGPIYTRRSESATTILYQRYKDKYTHTIAIHTTLAAAQAAISGKHTGSSAREIGAGIFISDGIDVTEEFQGQTAINKE